jgi:hypothetical protein
MIGVKTSDIAAETGAACTIGAGGVVRYIADRPQLSCFRDRETVSNRHSC